MKIKKNFQFFSCWCSSFSIQLVLSRSKFKNTETSNEETYEERSKSGNIFRKSPHNWTGASSRYNFLLKFFYVFLGTQKYSSIAILKSQIKTKWFYLKWNCDSRRHKIGYWSWIKGWLCNPLGFQIIKFHEKLLQISPSINFPKFSHNLGKIFSDFSIKW